MTCVCTEPGHCAVMGRYMFPRHFDICRHKAEGVSDAKCDAYQAIWLAENCRHRGETVAVAECQTCPGNVSLKISSCDVHGRAVLASIPGIQNCVGCTDREGK